MYILTLSRESIKTAPFFCPSNAPHLAPPSGGGVLRLMFYILMGMMLTWQKSASCNQCTFARSSSTYQLNIQHDVIAWSKKGLACGSGWAALGRVGTLLGLARLHCARCNGLQLGQTMASVSTVLPSLIR